MPLLRALVFLIALTATLAAALPVDLRGYETISLARGPQSHLFVTVQVRGKDALFGVDTGAPVTVFDARKAKTFGIERALGEGNLPLMIMLGTDLSPIGILPKLTARNFSFGSGPVVLADLTALEKISEDVPGTKRRIDGILGADVLLSHETIIDCAGARMYLRKSSGKPLTPPKGYSSVPMQMNDGRHFTIPCSVRGKRRRLIVDTGSFGTLFDGDSAKALGLTTRRTRFTSSSGLVRSPKPIYVTKVEALKIGRVDLRQETFGVTDLHRLLSVGEENLVGILGNDVLIEHQALIDLGAMKLYLRP
jgi:predicted aspartyl protease